jgi:hypothetical protein
MSCAISEECFLEVDGGRMTFAIGGVLVVTGSPC